jgi:hypothetical protein
MKTTFAIALLGGLTLAGAAGALPNTACRLTPGEQMVAFPRGAPPALVAAVNRDLSPYAMPGGAFNATDVVGPGSPPVMRRLVWVRRLGARFVVAYEQGGIAYFWKANAYQLSSDGRSVAPMGGAIAAGNDLCGPVERLLRSRTIAQVDPGRPGK